MNMSWWIVKIVIFLRSYTIIMINVLIIYRYINYSTKILIQKIHFIRKYLELYYVQRSTS